MAKSTYYIFVLMLATIGQISALSTEAALKVAKVMHRDCVKKTGVDENLIAECAKGYLPDDPLLKCYMKCLMTKVPVLKNGKIDEKFAISIVPPEHAEHIVPIIKECGTVKGVDDCDTAYQTNKCWQSKDPEHYFLV